MSEETERTAVQTYVPAHQREIWREEAESLDMSHAEFVRTMVQAGRRELQLGAVGEGDDEDPGGGEDPDADPWGSTLEERIHDAVAAEPGIDPDALVDAVVGDLEDTVLDTADALDDVSFSGRERGYVIDDGE